MRHRIAPYLSIMLIFGFAIPVLSNFKATKTKSPRSKQNISVTGHGKPVTTIVPQSKEGGLWRTDGGFQSAFMFKSILAVAPIKVTPVLYMADGTEYDLPQVNLDISGVAMVNINAALESAPSNIQSHISTYGSAGIRFPWSHSNAVYAAIRVTDDVRSLIYMNQLEADTALTHNVSAPLSSQVIEGTWWKQQPDVTGFVSVSNTSLNSISATLHISNADASIVAAQQLLLAPHSSQLIDLTSLWSQLPASATQGGIQITYSGTMDGLTATGGTQHDKKGYSAMLHFVARPAPQADSSVSSSADPSATPASAPEQVALDSPGIMIGTQDPDMQFPQGTTFSPYVVLRNISSTPMQVQLAVNYMQSGTPVDATLGIVTIAPQAAQQVDMKSMLTKAGLSGLNGFLNIRTSFTGFPGDLLEETGSTDQSMYYVFEVPPHRERWSQSRFINYWNTATDTDTMMTLWNFSDKDEDVILTFYHHEGDYQLPIHLAAHASTTMSVASLIKSGVPDSRGHRIPTNVVLGSAKLSGARDVDHINVVAYVGVFNVRAGTCYWALSPCDGVTGSYTTPDNLDFEAGVGDVDYISAFVTLEDGTFPEVTDLLVFSPDNSSIATVSCGMCGTVAITAAGTGNTSVGAGDFFYTPLRGGDFGFGCPDDCPTNWFNFGADVEVDPVVTDINTDVGTGSQALVGTTVNVTITGNGFSAGSGPSINIDPSISYTINSYTDTAIHATFTISTSAADDYSFSVGANDARAKISTDSSSKYPRICLLFSFPPLCAEQTST